MGASTSTNELVSSISQEIVETEVPSLSIVSIDDIVYSTDGRTQHGSREALTLVKPIDSGKLIQVNSDPGLGLFSSGSASIKLDSSNKPKKKSCGCACCRKRNTGMNDGASNHSFDGVVGPTEVITVVRSAEDTVVSPTDAFPLSKVASLDMERSEVGAKTKKTRRTRVTEKPDKPMGLWGLIKNAIGKDLTKMPLPVNFSEPLSMLQRLSEDYEYSSILDSAALKTDSLEQMAAVAAFTVSSYASCALRTAKPFNPLLGETYECDRTEDFGWRLVAEQVCHHPPIVSLHCESALGWVGWQQFSMKSNFKGTYLEILPLGIAHLRFKSDDNHYTWRKVSTVIRNLYIGKLYIEQEGEMDIMNHKTGERCHLKFYCGGMFSRDRTVTGKIYNRANEPKWEIRGAWDTEVIATKLDDAGKPTSDTRTLWKKIPVPPDAEKYYNFSVFTSQLNEMEEGVAPTDSRNRPDQRFMENALWDEANVEKVRLEEKQREARKSRLADGAANFSSGSKLETKTVTSSPTTLPPGDGVEPYYSPCWFVRQRDRLTGNFIYMYSGEYWSCKEKQDWARCPKIYDK